MSWSEVSGNISVPIHCHTMSEGLTIDSEPPRTHPNILLRRLRIPGKTSAPRYPERQCNHLPLRDPLAALW